MEKEALIISSLEGEPLRLVAAQLADGDLTCFRLACAAFRAHSAPPIKRSRSAFMRSSALARFATERLPGFRNVPGSLLLTLCAGVGEVVVVVLLRASGCNWSADAPARAALNGHLETLRWLHEHGCPWDERTCANVARGGHLEVLRWAHEEGCPWDDSTCTGAAHGGHLEVLRWAHEHGCP